MYPAFPFINKLRPVLIILTRKTAKVPWCNRQRCNSMKNDFAASDKKLRTVFIAQELEKTSKKLTMI
jgi:hypothetical protein